MSSSNIQSQQKIRERGQLESLDKNDLWGGNIALMCVLYTEKYIFMVTTQYEIKVFSMKNFKMKYSFMLSVESKIESIAVNDKVLAYSNEKGEIVLKNVFTDETFQVITNYENFPAKVDHLCFLPKVSEYFLG